MRKSLAGRVVIITRPRAVSGPLAAALKRRGARVVFAPLIRTVAPRSRRALDAALHKLSSFDAVAFTSVNAVEAFFARAKHLKKPRVVAAVGPATAKALLARGWRASIVPEDRRAEGLARELRLPRGARVLLPRAEQGREVLPRLLKAAGLSVTLVTAYRTLADHAGRRAFMRALAEGADAACFASGSAAESAVTVLGKSRAKSALRACIAVAIGPTTAAALRSRGIWATTANSADAEGLADAVARALRNA
jgi:uroporphyrinogen III methyltransferase/synthase